MNIEETKKIRLVDFLKAHGHSPVKVRGTNYWYLSPLREETDPSFKVNDYMNLWYDFGLIAGGDLVELCKYLYQAKDVSTVLKLMSEDAEIPTIPKTSHIRKVVSSEPMTDVEIKDLTHPALIKYGLSRGLDEEVFTHMCKEIHYRVGLNKFFGIAFKNDSDGYEIRNAYFKGCYKNKDITMIYTQKGRILKHVCVFEGFMDYLSYMSLMINFNTTTCINHVPDFIVMNSVANLRKTLVKLEQYEEIHCYLDTDMAGKKTFETIHGMLGDRAVDESYRYEGYKDLNDFIRGKRR